MSSAAIATVTQMMETLPEETQTRVVQQLREFILDLQDERQWDISFQRTQGALVAAARRAKQGMAAGLAQPLEPDLL
ncbi:MAG: hypothetical protein COZ06_11725 [Armatimonadetes bacterium CG_4_10_14_3_um_filter_66_18]|nr:hypothetical protein [Armatimonadota bacterium]OIP11161.1 MAG: hypothetical protein AUJ96_02880 [Armatimonadetes bacterium CG2_30_66_41]PIU91191.1 MAG: hypothetical protein COS65_22795 [Armatimonadetes bacterium CG06_land_8_20_14_3_00_66_21]PIW16790.1 MAG: hypothetical protein COW34_05620 [Armatimonadetes bacterium CG17_big_fil_post_rev_8_21_14_2_50_66_6]PIX48002.1 MAG: hypothetical protein COZ57_06930 [Armatimonadetes bacterium CG_4_8_14_3_um_filter_66_20]PIY49975.1 MAG: hypothetical prote